MNIVILNQYALPSGAAGITRHGDIGAELVRRGHRVTVIASAFDYFSRQSQSRPARSRHEGVEFVWLRTGAYVRNDRRRVRSMARFALSATRATLQVRPRPEAIVGSSPHLLAASAAASAAHLLRRPWVMEIRDFWPSSLVDLGALAAGGKLHRSLEWLERRLYLDADAIVSVPPNGRVRLEEVGVSAGTSVHIPNATTLDSTDGYALPASVHQILDELRGKLLILYTGALGVAQDLGVVLSGFAQLREHHPDAFDRVAFLFVGDGVERERTSALAEEMRMSNVRFHGALEKAAIPHLLAAADACLLHLAPAPVFKYGLSPNKLFDYFAASKPVLIASDYPTIVDEAEAGLRYRPGDPAALAEAVVQMVELSADERAAMGDRGHEMVRRRYSISAITDQYEALLKELTQQR
jgi:glycosyltransferase involved in cell wall biosynthesis